MKGNYDGIDVFTDYLLLRATRLVEQEKLKFPVDWDSEPYPVFIIAKELKEKLLIEENRYINEELRKKRR